MTAEQKALGFPRSTLATHTERKAVSLSLRSGDTMLIQGTNPPCSSCKGAMNLVAKITGAEIHYTWNGNIWSAGKPR